MAKYTTEVRSICETLSGLSESVGYNSIDKTIQNSREKIFDFDYPIFDEKYKPILETKILKHYYTREIGLETVGLWKLFLNTKMNEIMPYYNQLYKSTLLEFNPLYDVDITRSHKGESNGEVDSTSNNQQLFKSNSNYEENGSVNGNVNSKTIDKTSYDKNHLDKYSDTPQGGLTGIENNTYLTNARIVTDNDVSNNDIENSATNTSSITNKNTTTTNNESNTNEKKNQNLKNTEEYLETVQGKQGAISSSKLLMEYRETFLNIDLQIINELKDLFFNLW